MLRGAPWLPRKVRILFDQGTPVPLRQFLTQHEVVTAYERGWAMLTNGQLLAVAESEGFAVFVTTDTRLKYQQNLSARRIAIVVLSTPSWLRIQNAVEKIVRVIETATDATYFRGRDSLKARTQ